MQERVNRDGNAPWRVGNILDVHLDKIDTTYGGLRLVRPRADACMARSMARHGQLTPVVVGHAAEPSRYQLVDGFKRLRACRKLGFDVVKARILEGGGRSLKVAIVHLNRQADSINLVEEAMVVHSLYREDGLTQEEIAVLFERHKSWVCRRIALMERLSEEAHEHLRLGLVGVSIARELVRLPRGNQEALLRAVLEHRLTRRETECLVSVVLSRPPGDQAKLLRLPRETVQKGCCPGRELSLGVCLRQVLELLGNACGALEANGLVALSPAQRSVLDQELLDVQQMVGKIRAVVKGGPHGTDFHPQP